MQPYPPGYAPQVPNRRPAGVTILAVLQFIVSLVFLFGGLAFLALGAVLMEDPIASGGGLLMMAVGGVLLVLGLIGFFIGWGLWTLKEWARLLAMIFAVIGLLIGIVSVVSGSYTAVVGVLIDLLIIWYLTRPEVKAAFGVPTPGFAQPAPYPAPMQPAAYPPPVAGPAASSFCRHCGSSLPPGAVACPACGGPVA